MKKVTKSILAILVPVLFYTLSMLGSCDGDREYNEDCHDENSPCRGFDFSYVRKDTYENLIGLEGEPIHPDSIVIINLSYDTMYHEVDYNPFNGWWNVQRFSPYQELNCFNQCLTDSAFSRYYYIYIGNGDWDTLEVHFPAKTKWATLMELYFNGVDPVQPETGRIWFIKDL